MSASKRYLTISLLLIALLTGISHAAPRAAGGRPASQWDVPLGDAGARAVLVTDLRTDVTAFRVYLPLFLSRYSPASPSVRYASDTLYGHQWGLERVNAPGAWALSTGDDIVIAVLDTGVDLDHPDLEEKLLIDLARSFVDSGASVDDGHGHGTHVAGIAAAATDNSVGIAGMGWNAMILPLQVLGADGEGTVAGIADAIRYAADSGARVINMSVGGTSPQSCPFYLQQAVNDAYQDGAILISAAGNLPGISWPEIFPANCDHVLGVAATGQDDTLAPYSNGGHHVSVAAPGGYWDCSTCQIYSTTWAGDLYAGCTGRQYCYKSGTSMATPYVSGLAALLLARYPAYTPDEVASAILDNGVDLGTPGWDEEYGCGRIDAYASLSNGARGDQPVCLTGGVWSAQREKQTESVSDARFVPGEIIVQLRAGLAGAGALNDYASTTEYLPTLNIWSLQVPVGQERALLAQLRRDPRVLHADLNYIVTAQ